MQNFKRQIDVHGVFTALQHNGSDFYQKKRRWITESSENRKSSIFPLVTINFFSVRT